MAQLDLKKYSILRTIYFVHNNNFVLRRLQKTNKKKLVSPLIYTTKNCLGKSQAWVHFVSSQ